MGHRVGRREQELAAKRDEQLLQQDHHYRYAVRRIQRCAAGEYHAVHALQHHSDKRVLRKGGTPDETETR